MTTSIAQNSDTSSTNQEDVTQAFQDLDFDENGFVPLTRAKNHAQLGTWGTFQEQFDWSDIESGEFADAEESEMDCDEDSMDCDEDNELDTQTNKENLQILTAAMMQATGEYVSYMGQTQYNSVELKLWFDKIKFQESEFDNQKLRESVIRSEALKRID